MTVVGTPEQIPSTMSSSSIPTPMDKSIKLATSSVAQSDLDTKAFQGLESSLYSQVTGAGYVPADTQASPKASNLLPTTASTLADKHPGTPTSDQAVFSPASPQVSTELSVASIPSIVQSSDFAQQPSKPEPSAPPSPAFSDGANPPVVESWRRSKDAYSLQINSGQIPNSVSSVAIGSGSGAISSVPLTSSDRTFPEEASSFTTALAVAVSTDAPTINIETQGTMANGDGDSNVQSQSNSATMLAIGSGTSNVPAAATAAAAAKPPPVSIGSQILTADSETEYILGSQTLTPGAQSSVSGTPVSLAVDATEAFIGSSTEGLVGYSTNGISAGSNVSTPEVMPFTGTAVSRGEAKGRLQVSILLALALFLHS